jgi:hypothetical protein
MRQGITVAAAALVLAATAAPADAGLFSPGSWRNQPLPASAPLDPLGSVYVTTLSLTAAQAVFVSTTANTSTVYTVGDAQPGVHVRLVPPPGRGADARLQAAFDLVPLPPGAHAANGIGATDHPLTVYQPSRDRLWEFWKFRYGADGVPEASYGGSMEDVSSNPGHFTGPNDWPRGMGRGYGATATSIPLIAGLQRIDEIKRGQIDHAVAVSIAAPQNAFRWPAQRCDGLSPLPTAIPEGTRFRLPANVDVNALGLSAYGRAVARAVQRYGLIVVDKTARGVGFSAEAPTDGTNPYAGILDGKPLAGFPWNRLVALADRPPRGYAGGRC